MVKRTIDATLWKTGNSHVITIPETIIEKFKLKVGSKIEVNIELEEVQ